MHALDSDSPHDRILALRRNGLSVDELRQALNDEDPQVREAAAGHPDLTDGLLSEGLKHEDPRMRRRVLQHKGINEGHLESVLFDHDLRDVVSNHPKLSPEQGRRLVNDSLTAEYQRDHLLKSTGYVEFPKFGQPGPVEAGPASQERMQLGMRLRGKGDTDEGGKLGGLTVGRYGVSPARPANRGYSSLYDPAGKNWKGSRAHETQHGVFHRIKQDWGRPVADKLLAHIQMGLSFAEKRALKALTIHPAQGYAIDNPEEHLAYAQSYLNDEHFRRGVHNSLRLRQPHQQRAFAASVKSAVQKMRDAAYSVQPGQLGVVRKTEVERVGEYLQKVLTGDPMVSWHMQPQMPNPHTRFTSIESHDRGDGMYHHIYRGPHHEDVGYTPILHAISESENPFNHRGIRSTASVGEYDAERFRQDSDTQRYQHPFVKGPMAMVHSIATDAEHRGHGFGSALYEAMGKHHGQLVSDSQVSPLAEKRWQGLAAHPDFKAGLGAEKHDLHHATYTGPKSKPFNVITNPGLAHTFGELKEKHAPEPIEKASPPPAFPRLHIGPQRRETQVIEDDKQLHGALRRLHGASARTEWRGPIGELGQAASRVRANKETKDAMRGAARRLGWNLTGNHGFNHSAVLGTPFQDPHMDPVHGVTNPKTGRWLEYRNTDRRDAAVRSNQQHEDLHGLFGLVERKYGTRGRRVLAHNLFYALPSFHQHALDEMHHALRGDSYDRNHLDEEKLASLMNYMNGAPTRDRYHSKMGHTDEQRRIYNGALKSTYRALQAAAAKASEKWTEEPQEFSKAEDSPEESSGPSLKELAQASIRRMKPEHREGAQAWFDFVHGLRPRPLVSPAIERHLARFGVVDPSGYSYDQWGHDLAAPLAPSKRSKGGAVPDALREAKQRNNWGTYNLPYQKDELEKIEAESPLFAKAEDIFNAVALLQAGASGLHEPLMRAAAFLAHQAPDDERFRVALALDLEPEEAALKAVGLEPTAENLHALRAILSIQAQENRPSLRKALGEEHTVLGEDKPLAALIQECMNKDDVDDVKLQGKHTGGTRIVTDRDHDRRFLLKPGSGPLSPAAGVAEETASQSKREVSYWEIGSAWGLGELMPSAALLTIDGIETAVMPLLPANWENLDKLKASPHALHEALGPLLLDGRVHRMAILDYVLGNADSHGSNVMVGPKSEGYPMRWIDHGSTFAGFAFDPGHDTKSFIPFTLRAGAGRGWKTMNSQQRLHAMPSLQLGEDDNLRTWVQGLDDQKLVEICSKYGIRAEPSLHRLDAVKRAATQASSLSHAVNEMWLGL